MKQPSQKFFFKKVFYVSFNLNGVFFCIVFFSMSLPQTGVSGLDISGFAVRRWNPTPDLTSLSTVKTRASCYSSSDYFISKSSTINHHPFLEKFNAYAQTEACNQSFTVPGTAGFHPGNRGGTKRYRREQMEALPGKADVVFIFVLSGEERGQS